MFGWACYLFVGLVALSVQSLFRSGMSESFFLFLHDILMPVGGFVGNRLSDRHVSV